MRTFEERSRKFQDYQIRIGRWLHEAFGLEVAQDRMERNHRFIEEAIELVQANGCTKSEVLQLVDYVFDRPVGEVEQEVGGVMTTLAALCWSSGQSMGQCAENEHDRIWLKIGQIRAKQAAKPKQSPLPQEVCKTGSANVPVVPNARVKAVLLAAMESLHFPVTTHAAEDFLCTRTEAHEGVTLTDFYSIDQLADEVARRL